MKINFRAPINRLGFGIFSTIYFKHMLEIGAEVSWSILSNGRDIQEELHICNWFGVSENEFADATSKPFFPDVPVFTLWHPHDLKNGSQQHEVNAITFFETTGLLPEELDSMNSVSSVSLTSDWGVFIAKTAFKAQHKVFKAPGIYTSKECPYFLRPTIDTPSNIVSIEPNITASSML